MPTIHEDHTPDSTHWACEQAMNLKVRKVPCCKCTNHDCPPQKIETSFESNIGQEWSYAPRHLRNNMLTKQQLTEIEERMNKATSGPWTVDGVPENTKYEPYEEERIGDIVTVDVAAVISPSKTVIMSNEEFYPQRVKMNDMKFCAHARQDVLALIQSLREAWDEIDELKKKI